MITDRIGQHKALLPNNHNRYNFRKIDAFFFGERAFNTKCPKLGKKSPAETLTNVTNSSILENLLADRDNFCDWWILLSAL